MSNTPVIEHVWVMLSCNHRVGVPAGQPVGAQVSCEKCPKGKDDEFRVRRIKRLLAKVEHTALKAWETNGRKGDRPTSANLDAMNDDYAAGTKPGKSSKGRTKRAAWNPRRVMAGDAQKAAGNRRGPGVKVSDEDLAAYVRKVRSEHPESPRNDELEVGYWVEKLAISRPRWNAAWDAVDREESGQ